jgi:hypothetical protein
MRLRPPEPETVVLLAQAWWRLLHASARLRWSRRLPAIGGGDPSGPVAPTTPDTDAEVRRIAWAVARVAPVVPGAACLAQALAARDWLARLGVPTVLRVGVRRSPASALSAHAWLEHDGHVVLGHPDAPYVVLDRHRSGQDR